MTDYSNSPELKNSVLGKSTEYVDTYTPSLLFPIARKLNRDALGVSEDNLPLILSEARSFIVSVWRYDLHNSGETKNQSATATLLILLK